MTVQLLIIVEMRDRYARRNACMHIRNVWVRCWRKPKDCTPRTSPERKASRPLRS